MHFDKDEITTIGFITGIFFVVIGYIIKGQKNKENK